MAKGKKGSNKKGKKISKEERKARKEQKKLARIAAAEEAKRQLRRDQLNREVTLQKRHWRDLDASWKQVILSIEIPLSRQDVEVMWRSFERAYDKKDGVLHELLQLLLLADEQHRRSLAFFVFASDLMLTKFEKDLYEQQSQFEEDMTSLRSLAIQEETARADAQALDERHLRIVRLAGQTEAEEEAARIKGENMVRLDEEVLKGENACEVLRSLLEGSYARVWDQIKETAKRHEIDTRAARAYARRVLRGERENDLRIAEHARTLANNDKMLRRFRVELRALCSDAESGDTKRHLRSVAHVEYTQAVEKLSADLLGDEQRLSDLTLYSDLACKHLLSAREKYQRIIRMLQLCRKLETLNEKVLPIGLQRPVNENQKHKKGKHQKMYDEKQNGQPAVDEEDHYFEGIEVFWQKVSYADLVRRELAEEKDFLMKENNELSKIITKQTTFFNVKRDGKKSGRKTTLVAIDGHQLNKKHNTCNMIY